MEQTGRGMELGGPELNPEGASGEGPIPHGALASQGVGKAPPPPQPSLLKHSELSKIQPGGQAGVGQE